MKNKTCRQINERDLILSDPIICAVLEIEAEKAGNKKIRRTCVTPPT